MLDLVAAGDGVYYAAGNVDLCDAATVGFLKSQAARAKKRRARICFHRSPESVLQNMLIALHRDSYVPPHRHLRKSESFLVVEGTGRLCIFDDTGGVTAVHAIGPSGSDLTFCYHMPAGIFHTQIVDTEWLVFHESTQGPFVTGETEAAPWAPDQSDDGGARVFVERLRSTADSGTV